jgi:hypothetical protein
MPQISGDNLQQNHIIETCKEEGCAVSTQETAARRKWEMGHLTRFSAPWTDSHPHPRIFNQLAGGNKYHVKLGAQKSLAKRTLDSVSNFKALRNCECPGAS